MFRFLKKAFGSSVNYNELMNRGAVIIDVRSPNEFASGHIKGSQNIPLNEVLSKMDKLSQDKPIITCCASGIRSASAKASLKSKGFKDVYNGGGWRSLESKMKA